MMDAELAASIRQSKSTNSGTEKVKASKTEAHLRIADYLGPHHGAGGLRTAAQVPA
jgi:hypothetical protein